MHTIDVLVNALKDRPAGLCGHHEPACAVETVADTEQRLRVLTLGAIMDVFPIRDRWETLAELSNHWLLDPGDVAYRKSQEVGAAMHDAGLGGPKQNARVWWQVCRGIQGRYKGSIRDMLRDNSDDAIRMQTYLFASKTTFPVLSGPVISAQWLDLVHRIGDVKLERWDELVMELSETQKQAAQAFGVKAATRAHPATAAGLSIWNRACERLNPPDCGLDNCPRRESSITTARTSEIMPKG
jgi:hypothetical protein